MPKSIPPLAILAGLLLSAPSAAEGSWEPGIPLPFPKAKNFAVVWQGDVYVVGGSPWRNGGDQDGSVFRMDATGWTEVEPLGGMGPATDQVGGVDDLGRIVVFGGQLQGSGDIGSARAYLPTKGTNEDLPSPVNYPFNYVGTAVDAQHRVYSIGGGYGPSGLNYGQVGRWIGSEHRWENLAYLPYTRAAVASTYDGNGHIWCVGGYTSFGAWRIPDTVRYDIATNTWSTHGVVFLPTPTADAQAVLGTDGMIYIIGGSTSSQVATATVWVLDPREESLRSGPPLGVARRDFATVLGPDHYVYVMGGTLANGTATTAVERLYTGHCASIESQPGPTSVASGGTLSLEATVTGDDLDSFEWIFAGKPLVDGPNGHGGTVSGAGTPSLAITAFTPADAGEYTFIAYNPCGGAASEPIPVSLAGGLVGDLDGDGHVRASDLGMLLSAWGTSSVAADLDRDGIVGAGDLASLLGAWTG